MSVLVRTSASVPRAGEAGAAGGRSVVTAAGMEEFVWLLSSATARRDLRDIIVEKVNLLHPPPLSCIVTFISSCLSSKLYQWRKMQEKWSVQMSEKIHWTAM